MENIKDTNVPAEQVETTSQDDAIASAKQRVKNSYEKKIANEYVPLDKFNELQEKYNKLDAQLKLPEVTKQLVAGGLKQDAVNDFIKLHPEVMSNNKETIAKVLAETKTSNAYMFEQKAFNATALPPSMVQDKAQDKPLYTIDSNGFLIKNK